MVDFDKAEFLKELRSLSNNGKEAIRQLQLMNLESQGGIPNRVMMEDNQVQFNVKMSEQVKNLVMNFSVYEGGINSYLLELTSYIPGDDFVFPPGAVEETMLFKLTGSPMLGAHTVTKPISALSIQEAVEAALEYVFDNFEDILKEVLGGEHL